jgi:hypothetical protein
MFRAGRGDKGFFPVKNRRISSSVIPDGTDFSGIEFYRSCRGQGRVEIGPEIGVIKEGQLKSIEKEFDNVTWVV